MQHIVFLFTTLILSSTVCAQIPPESQRFLTESLGRVKYGQIMLGNEELLSQFAHYDFSSLWTKHDRDILAFIGDDYQRLRVKYLAIIRNAESPEKYYVYGKRLVDSSVCQFMGEIDLMHVRMFDESERQRLYQEELMDSTVLAEGNIYGYPLYTLLAEYRFYEDPNQKGGGVFRGVLCTDFYVDSGNVHYDSLQLCCSDYFRNNQYVGTWTSYAGGAPKRCNWGEWRVPDCGDLDWGAGEFGPRPKYYDNGWRTYVNAQYVTEPEYTAARKEEEREWWKE